MIITTKIIEKAYIYIYILLPVKKCQKQEVDGCTDFILCTKSVVIEHSVKPHPIYILYMSKNCVHLLSVR